MQTPQQDKTGTQIYPFHDENEWSGAVRLRKYLLDHSIVSGDGHFLLHVPIDSDSTNIDIASQPDAQVNDPLRRHLGALLQYSDRIRDLLDGHIDTSAATPLIKETEQTGESIPEDTQLTPENDYFKVAHYTGEPELYYLFNESDCRYDGVINLPQRSSLYEYDAWNDLILELDYWNHDDKSYVNLSIDPGKSMVIVCGGPDDTILHAPLFLTGEKIELREFIRTVCKCADYPAFSKRRRIKKPERYSKKHKRYQSVIRYETAFPLAGFKQVALEITDAFEAVEVFVNGNSAGVQIVPAFVFDLTEFCNQGENNLVIEVTTTYERDRNKQKKAAPAGITGSVRLYIE